MYVDLFGIIPHEPRNHTKLLQIQTEKPCIFQTILLKLVADPGFPIWRRSHSHWGGWGCKPPLQSLFGKNMSKVKNWHWLEGRGTSSAAGSANAYMKHFHVDDLMVYYFLNFNFKKFEKLLSTEYATNHKNTWFDRLLQMEVLHVRVMCLLYVHTCPRVV